MALCVVNAYGLLEDNELSTNVQVKSSMIENSCEFQEL